MIKVKSATARTPGQKKYLQCINEHKVTICHGPAGSGKTYLAAATAAYMLGQGKVNTIVLGRPVVSCGNDIGFLPGNLDEKFSPYITPVMDQLAEFFDEKEIRKMVEDKVIQMVPSAFMRGRTFNNSFVIFDEAQNATKDELRMFLTRFGQQSKMVLAGDSSQSDMPGRDFDWVTSAVSRIPAVGVSRLGFEDIVREKLVGEIVIALDEADRAPKAFNNFASYDDEFEYQEL